MSPNLIQQLESLSGYRQIFPPQDPKAALNPVAQSHIVLNVAGRRFHVLSRICDAGLDYTQRTNKFAHHIVLDAAEVPAAGPAWLLAYPGFMRSKWEGEPGILPVGPVVPKGESPPCVCRAWQQITGDAGWGGMLAEIVAGSANRPAMLIFRPGMDMLALLAETLVLLPAELRWRVSFNTYFNKLPPGIDCQWRCVVDGTPEAVAARRTTKGALIIDLCQPLGRAAEGAYVNAARTGKTQPIRIPSPSKKVEDLQLADIGLEYSLQKSTKQIPKTDIGNQHIMPPPPEPLRKQSIFLPRQFRRKPPPRWPWILAAALLIFVFVGVGVLVWTAQFNKDNGTAVAGSNKPNDIKVVAAKEAENNNATDDKKKVEGPNSLAKKADEIKSETAEKERKQSEIAVEKTKPKEEGPTEEKKGPENPKVVVKNIKDKELKAEKDTTKPDPFREFRDKAYNVPIYKFVSAAGRDMSKSERFSLIKLPDSPSKCEINLISLAGMFPDEWIIKLSSNGSNDRPYTWDCILEKGTGIGHQIQRIAIIRIDKGILNIKWEEDNQNVDIANLLRNCPLRITMADCDEAVIYLREPIVTKPIDVAELAKNKDFVKHLPVDDVPHISIEFEILAPWPTGLKKPEMENGNPQIWLLRSDEDESIWFRLQVEHKGYEKDIILTFTDLGFKVGDKMIYAYTVAEYIRSQQAEMQNQVDNKKKEKEKDLGKLQEDDKRKLPDKINDIEKQIGDLEKNINRAIKINEIYRKLVAGGKINYRVYLPIDKYKVDLIRTDQQILGP
jgi:hypothetical protein